MKLSAGTLALALKLQEVMAAMGQNDVRTRLSDCLSDMYRGTGKWAYLVDVFGDDKAGDVIYSCDGDLCKAPYTCDATGAKIDTAAAKDVVPLTTYQEEPAETLMEAGARNSKRDMMQLQSIHDHAASLGANCSMKEAATDGGTKVKVSGSIALKESATTVDVIRLQEARADYMTKLIAPGRGSSAYYPREVLKRDGPKVFKAGTHVYLNHPTAAEEAARPEGDVANLAGVLSADAVYLESHPNGEGVYAPMKVFADHAQMVEEKAAHVGMSIRASGIAESGKMRDGVPVLKELTAAESVDVVTRAGAGGMILTESARPAQSQQEADSMTAEEAKKLIEAGVAAAVAPLRERAIRGDARDEAGRLLATVSLPQVAKTRIIERAIATLPVKEDGELNLEKFREIVVAESKTEGEYISAITGSGRVHGMGTAPAPVVDIKTREAMQAEAAADEAETVRIFAEIGLSEAGAKAAAKGRAA